ncbi:MAG: hypothetical protein M1837_004627 [Sclerophora amabilis]|nr:MAG: hypothetical protein M1837_004627 [Sclerophora amabilis]
MRLPFPSLLVALFAVAAFACPDQKKAVLVSYSNDTPDSVLSQAKDAIIKAGGVITHEYSLFKGFAATAPAKALEAIKVAGSQYNPVVEEDQVVSVQNSDS